MPILNKLPGVVNPVTRLNFKSRVKWTAVGLLLFFLMGSIEVFGATESAYAQFQQVSVLLGSTFGTLGTLGIGPIVTSSILLQVLVGSKIINIDMNSQEGRAKFQGTQKTLAMAFCFLEGFAYVMFGAVPAQSTSLIPIVALQIALGGLIIVFLDELIMKWGLGSGVSLFIAAGVSKAVFIGLISPFGETAAGMIPQIFQFFAAGQPGSVIFPLSIIGATVLVFALCLYAQSIKVEIPLAFSQIRGFGRRWPLNFFYTSNIPVILAAAFTIQISMMGSMLDSQGIPFLGEFDDQGNAENGIAYYLSIPRHGQGGALQDIMLGLTPVDPIRLVTYTLFLSALCVIFALFWVETANMGPDAVADQITSTGMQIPGFRKDKRVLMKILSKYIYPLTIIGGIAVGLLAALADLTGALGTGTGILLTVMILHNFYERISTYYLEDMNPAVRKFFEIG